VQLFETRIGGRESRPLGLPGGDLFAVSSSGEMAISLAPRFFLTYRQDGTLARASLSGGGARELFAEVHAADWAPGGDLAIARTVDGKERLEFPPGKVVCQTEGAIHSVRISPRGDRIAFMEFGGGGQTVKVVGLAGEPKALSGPWWITSRGLAWSASGEEVWFSASRDGTGLSLYAVDLFGRERLVMRLPGGLRLHDIDRSGRVLVSLGDSRMNLIVSRGGEAEKEISGFDTSFLEDLSPEGQTVIFTRPSSGANLGSPVYLRKMDGSPAVLLGEGYDLGVSLSPDGQWALAKRAGASGGLVLLPIGAGDVRELRSGAIRLFGQWGFLAGGKQILVAGQEPGHRGRLYVLDLSDEKIRPLSEEGIFRGQASADGRSVVAQAGRFGEGKILIYSLDGGPSRIVPGSRDKYLNRLAGWSADSRFLYLYRVGDVPVQIYQIDVETGEQQLWKQVAPADPAGVPRIHPVKVTPDGKSYAYSYIRGLNDLYVFDGLK
jgi:Tol biopolymer transport system component